MGVDSWVRFGLTELYALVLLAFVFRRPLQEEKKNGWLKILLIMLAMYLAWVFYIMLTPTYFFRRFAFSTERLNLVPFRALKEWLAHPFNFFGNVLLFMPIGFFEILLHPGRSRKWQLAFSAATAAVLSLIIEFAQCFNYRVPDVDDLILNTIGAVLGALLCMFQQRIGFDRTRVGRVLLPRIPRLWHRHERLNRFCVILIVTLEAVLFTANYIVTIPRPAVRENEAANQTITLTVPAEQTEPPVSTPAETDVPEPAGRTEPETGAQAETGLETPASETEKPEPEFHEAAVPAAPVFTPRTYDTEGLELEAGTVLLVRLSEDALNAQVIYAVDSTKPIYPASTIKMLTALTALDIAQPDETVRLGMEIYIPPLDASRASLEYGMTFTIRELLEGLLLPSGADAAYALGVYCGRKMEGNSQASSEDAVRSFVAAMNRKATAIGAVNTTAVNVVGLDAKGQTTTAEDLLKITKVFLDQPVLAEICSLPTAKITSEEGKSISLKNTNKMLFPGGEYYNRDVAGVKTGTTSRAGNCLISVFSIGGERYLCIVMNSSYYGKFTDTQKLYEVCAAGHARQ